MYVFVLAESFSQNHWQNHFLISFTQVCVCYFRCPLLFVVHPFFFFLLKFSFGTSLTISFFLSTENHILPYSPSSLCVCVRKFVCMRVFVHSLFVGALLFALSVLILSSFVCFNSFSLSLSLSLSLSVFPSVCVCFFI